MIRTYRVVFTFALVSALFLPNLQSGLGAFELFPRPKGQYTVKRGDTLYGIAGLYYTNPALWPFLWNQNPAVKIPPGQDPKKAELKPGMNLDLHYGRFPYTVMNLDFDDYNGLPDDVRFLTEKLPYRGIPYDRKYFRFKLGAAPARVWGYIVSAPDEGKAHYLDRDLVYIRFRPSKRQCVLVGDRFGVFRERGPVSHPLNPERIVGHFAEVVGEVEVINTGHNLITAIVLDAYKELKRSDKICLFVPRDKEIIPTKTHRMLTGTILRSASRETFYTRSHNLQNDIVFVDQGECDGMKEGMLLNIYRPSQPVEDPYTWRRVNTPDKYVGEGMILKAFKNNSTVLITVSREEVVPGDIIKTVSD